MAKQEKIKNEQTDVENIAIRLTERDCPRCDAILIHNDNEQCYECINCGYIHCGSDKDWLYQTFKKNNINLLKAFFDNMNKE